MQNISLEQAKIMIKFIKEKYPNKDSDFYRMYLSTGLLRLLIDNEWVNQSIFFMHNEKSPRTKKDRKFLKTEDTSFQRQERISRLAERVFNLQGVKNINNIILKIKEGNVSGCFAELEAAAHLYRRQIPFEFVKESGIKGSDFDIRINWNPIINCEVKHKIEDTKLSRETIERSLKDARSQLPRKIPCLIFLKIPEEWTKQEGDREIIQNAINIFFVSSNSSNVIGVVLRREQRNSNNEGIFYWPFKLLTNKDFDIENEGIQTILKIISSEGKDNQWIQIKDIVNEFL